MTATTPRAWDGRKRPPRAVVGSQINRDEEMFGAAFDQHVVRRFLTYVYPYRRRLYAAVGALLFFTGAQLAIPLVIRYAIDHAIVPAMVSAGGDTALLWVAAVIFAAVIVVNYAANFMQDWLVSRTGEQVIFDLRRAMFAHLQYVALAFMDKTEVGRMMSRLQGDVYALQEFLENSITAFGDLLLLFGIVVIMLWLDFNLGLLTLSVVPILFFVRLVWLPRARVDLSPCPGDQFHRQRRPGRRHSRGPYRAGDAAGGHQLRSLRREGDGQPERPPAVGAIRAGSWCPSSIR